MSLKVLVLGKNYYLWKVLLTKTLPGLRRCTNDAHSHSMPLIAIVTLFTIYIYSEHTLSTNCLLWFVCCLYTQLYAYYNVGEINYLISNRYTQSHLQMILLLACRSNLATAIHVENVKSKTILINYCSPNSLPRTRILVIIV